MTKKREFTFRQQKFKSLCASRKDYYIHFNWLWTFSNTDLYQYFQVDRMWSMTSDTFYFVVRKPSSSLSSGSYLTFCSWTRFSLCFLFVFYSKEILYSNIVTNVASLTKKSSTLTSQNFWDIPANSYASNLFRFEDFTLNHFIDSSGKK